MPISVERLAPQTHIFSENEKTDLPEVITPSAPITAYRGFLRPADDAEAKALGDRCVEELKRNIIADFEKNDAYGAMSGDPERDRMVHVSTFVILDGYIYMTYYANTGTDAENPSYQEARLAFCPEEHPEDMTILTIQKVGDTLDGKTIDLVYDTILLDRGGEELYILWTASANHLYYRFFCTFNRKTHTLSPILPNRFRVGNTVNDFSVSGIVDALRANRIPHKVMFSDIGIMQKLSTREENGVTYYYTGAYSGNWNAIIKSRDFIEWEYVATPDFINLSLWENATYVLGDKCYYFVRQDECMQGFLTCYDLVAHTWEVPFLVKDAQSRSDFVYDRGNLYLIHAPINRDGFGILRINTEDIHKSTPVLVADMKESLFYPFARIYGNDLYLSYTVDRKHIRLSKFCFRDMLR